MKLHYPPSKCGNYQIMTDTWASPHPYTIGPKHVSVAADHFGGMLGEDAIVYAEKHYNATCCQRGCRLPYKEHTPVAIVACKVDMTKSKEEQEKLQNYLKEHSQDLGSKGINGISFLDKFSEKSDDEAAH